VNFALQKSASTHVLILLQDFGLIEKACLVLDLEFIKYYDTFPGGGMVF